MKQRRHLFIITGLTLLIGFSSCRTHRFISSPTKPNITFFDQQGQGKISGAASSTGIEGQAAYAITNHLAVTGAASIGMEEKNTDRKSVNNKKSTLKNKQNDFELGIGYSFPINADKTIFFNLFGGVGMGDYAIDEAEDSTAYRRNFKSKTFRWYVQPSFNFQPSDAVHFAVFFKPTFIKYKDFSTNYTQQEKEFFGFDVLQDKTILLPQFGYDIEVKIPGTSWLYLEHSFSYTPRPEDLSDTQLRVHTTGLSIGLTAELGQ